MMEKPIVLRHGPWAAQVLPCQGMTVLSLSCQGKQILRSPDPENLENALKQSPFLYGTPLLFPAGRVRDGFLTAGDQSFSLPINEPLRGNHLHGRLFNAPFQVTMQTDAEIQGFFRNQDRARFPLDMKIESRCLLNEEGLTQEWTVTNLDCLPMPVSFALHTAFLTPRKIQLDIGRKWALDERLCATGYTARKSDTEEFLSLGFCPGGVPLSGMYEMTGPARIDGYLYQASPPFDTWVIYNGKGQGDYVCIEPQCGIGLSAPGRDPLTLAPGQSVLFWTQLSQISAAPHI